MRQITNNARNAFENNQVFGSGNTTVTVVDGTTSLILLGNTIAIKDKDGLRITNCGWQTNVTKERLNALRGVSIHQKDYSWYLNGILWNGDWVTIN